MFNDPFFFFFYLEIRVKRTLHYKSKMQTIFNVEEYRRHRLRIRGDKNNRTVGRVHMVKYFLCFACNEVKRRT